MKIILIVPPITHREMHGKLALAASEEPSLGLCYIAANLRKFGYRVKIIDALALRLKAEEVVRQVLAEEPDLVGLTAVTLTINRAHHLARMIKTKRPDIRILIGGAHLTALPESTMERFTEFDYGIIGEGEETTVNLLNVLREGKDLNKVKGIIFRRDGHLVMTAPLQYIHDLDSLPLPAWDMIPELKRYYHPPTYNLGRIPSSSLITTRGCGFKCTFCFQEAFGRNVRAHSAEKVLEMIEMLYHRYGIRDLRIVDDNFTLFKERLFKITDGIKKKRLNLSFSCFARIDTINSEILKALKLAGCWQILFGIESGVQKILDLVQKNITLEKIKDTLEMVRRYGIHTHGYFMVGFPTETKETIEQTINFALKLPLNCFKMQFLTPLPGSELYWRAHQYGYFDKENFEAMNTDSKPAFIPFGLTQKELIFYQRKAFRKFYFRPRIIIGYLKFIKNSRAIIKLFIAAVSLVKFCLSKEQNV